MNIFFLNLIPIKMSSFKSSENIQKKVGGPDRSISNNKFFSVTLNELAMIARDGILQFRVSSGTQYSILSPRFQEGSQSKD